MALASRGELHLEVERRRGRASMRPWLQERIGGEREQGTKKRNPASGPHGLNLKDGNGFDEYFSIVANAISKKILCN